MPDDDSYDFAEDASPPPPSSPHPPPPPRMPPRPVSQQLGYAGVGAGITLDNSARARTASTMLKVFAGLSLITSVLQALPYFIGNPFNTAFTPGGAPEASALAVTLLNALVGCVAFILFVIAAVYFCMWQYRATHNANALGQPTTFTPGWGVGGLFIPLANFVMAPMQWFSLWRASGHPSVAKPSVGSPVSLVVVAALALLLYIAFMVGMMVWMFQQVSAAGPGGPASAPPELDRGFLVILGVFALILGLFYSGFWFLLSRFVDHVEEAQQRDLSKRPSF